jgi:hypothetical protein
MNAGAKGSAFLDGRASQEITQMNRENFFVGILAVGCLVATFMLMPSVGHAEADPRVTKSMETLKAMTGKLGAPKLEGNEAVGGKDAPALYFGTTKINNNFDIVDAVVLAGPALESKRTTARCLFSVRPT